MKKVVFALVALLLCCSCSRYEKVNGDPLDARIYTLDNGLQLYMSVNREKPRIQTYIAVRAGGKNGPDNSTGLAHYFEHLMFKGTRILGTSDYAAEEPLLREIEDLFNEYRATSDSKERAAIYHRIDSLSFEASKISIPNEYDKAMAVIGASGTNAWTSMDETVYQEDIPSNQIDTWARIQADRFRNVVIRGFHTELETVYEEKNMSLTDDTEKAWEAMDGALFPEHPYGNRTVLGTQEHLKNPSITDIRNFHDEYYVPNNIRICVAGDFDPDEMVAAVERYFGDWEPNPGLELLPDTDVTPLSEPSEITVYGLESESVIMGWRCPAARDLRNAAVAQMAASVLYNGKAGLVDLNVNQQQKVLGAYAFNNIMADAGEFVAMGLPKDGQSLEEVRDILLGQVEKLRAGDFDESLLESIVNNSKLRQMRLLESNSGRALEFVSAFIDGIQWKDAVHRMDRLEAVTKEDIVAWANEYLSPESCVTVYKHRGVDNTVSKISAPKITPIATNRDSRSAFLAEIQSTEPKPVEPVFLDFAKDLHVSTLQDGVDLLYKKNELNGIFQLQFEYNASPEELAVLDLAAGYVDYLGTSTMSAEQISSTLHNLACSFSVRTSDHGVAVNISGLAENMPRALDILESLMAGAVPDEQILAGYKGDILKARTDSKTNQSACFSALSDYIFYGPEHVRKSVLTNAEVAAMSSETLLEAIGSLSGRSCEILYYGPDSEKDVKEVLARYHKVPSEVEKVAAVRPAYVQTPEAKVFVAPYDAKQIYYLQYSCRGEKFSADNAAEISLYNEYFGGGMNGVVFQEMREARGLAYSARARLNAPSCLDNSYMFNAFIATQNDKARTAVLAFDDIINEMPLSEAAFNVAKDALVGRMRTQRITGFNVLRAYQQARELGLDEPLAKRVFQEVQDLTLEDVAAVQNEWVKDRTYHYGILGDWGDLDRKFIGSLGPVRQLTLEEIFGY